jgi:IS30 family transposase
MSQEQHTTKARKYQHLNESERQIIERLRRNGKQPAEIAHVLCRNRSTIGREIRRGSVAQRKTVQSNSKRIEVPLYTETATYFADVGEREYRKRRENTGTKCRLAQCLPFVEYLEAQVLSPLKWSPDAVVGKAKTSGQFAYIPSTRTVYHWIDQGLCKVKNLDLLLKVRRRKRTAKPRVNKRVMGKSIDERPASIEQRTEFGHWEGDGIVGTHQKGHLISLVERTSGYGFLFDVGDRNAVRISEVAALLKLRYCADFTSIFRSVTFDNGSEFSGTGVLTADGMDVYYAHPFSSWERGTNENWNGIVRRFLPKKTSFEHLPVGLVERIAGYINNLPRKRFGYRSPADLFKQQLAMVSST